jgi:3-oxoadipate enol-lactonase
VENQLVRAPVAQISEFAPPGRRIKLEGRGDIWIREHPDRQGRPPVLLLHGLGATAGLNWSGAFARFDPSLRAIGVDHRGHGRGIRTRRFSLEECADDIAALIRQLGLGRPVVAGYSMGGPIATLLWQRHPDCVGSLVLCATGGSFSGGAARRIAYQWAGGMGLLPSVTVPFAVTRRRMLEYLTPAQWEATRMARWAITEMSGHDPRSLWQAVDRLSEFDSSRWLRHIDVPTTVIATTKDRLVPLAVQRAVARSIPGAELRAVSAGHLCVTGRGEAEFLETLDQACREMCTGPSGASATAQAV